MLVQGLTDEQLYEAAQEYLDSDSVWRDFHEGCEAIAAAAREQAQEQEQSGDLK